MVLLHAVPAHLWFHPEIPFVCTRELDINTSM